jgi:hypothetical protein
MIKEVKNMDATTNEYLQKWRFLDKELKFNFDNKINITRAIESLDAVLTGSGDAIFFQNATLNSWVESDNFGSDMEQYYTNSLILRTEVPKINNNSAKISKPVLNKIIIESLDGAYKTRMDRCASTVMDHSGKHISDSHYVKSCNFVIKIDSGSLNFDFNSRSSIYLMSHAKQPYYEAEKFIVNGSWNRKTHVPTFISRQYFPDRFEKGDLSLYLCHSFLNSDNKTVIALRSKNKNNNFSSTQHDELLSDVNYKSLRVRGIHEGVADKDAKTMIVTFNDYESIGKFLNNVQNLYEL